MPATKTHGQMLPVQCGIGGKIYDRTYHLLLSAWGERWRKVRLVMFTVHIDDSGTAPEQQVAIASALIIPAARIPALGREWQTLKEKEGFESFHMSECVARNPHSEFAQWDDEKQQRVIVRVRQIGKKYGVKAYSFAINKADYDELVPSEIRQFTGKYHYTWAIRSVVAVLDRWADAKQMTIPFEYIYDWMNPKSQKEAKEEIETVMAQAEDEGPTKGRPPGWYTNYSFRRRQDIPALQCTDALAWACYQYALFAHEKKPLTPLARTCWDDYMAHPAYEWLWAVTMKREHLKDWIDREIKDGRSLARFREWEAKHPSTKAKKTEQGNGKPIQQR